MPYVPSCVPRALAPMAPDDTLSWSKGSGSFCEGIPRWRIVDGYLFRDVMVLSFLSAFGRHWRDSGKFPSNTQELSKVDFATPLSQGLGGLFGIWSLSSLWRLTSRAISRRKRGPDTQAEAIALAKKINKRVAIVGSGISGIQCIKSCLAEGVEPVCFEADSDIAGFWRFKPDTEHPSVYESTFVDTDRDLAGYADCPWNPKVPLLLKHDDVYHYLLENVRTFGLSKYLHFNRRVVSVVPHDVVDSKWRWAVTTMTKEGTQSTEVFDGVIVAAGKHGGGAFVPNFPGLENFPLSKQMHSSMYKAPETHGINSNTTVLVVGIGNSGLDIVTEVSPIAKKTILVSRSGAWITRSMHGDDAFSHATDRLTMAGFITLPWFIQNPIFERYGLLTLSDQPKDQAILAKHGLAPKHKFMQQHVLFTGLNGRAMLHDELEAGRISVRKSLLQLHPDSKVTTTLPSGDVSLDEVDLVIFATGYKQQAGFVDEQVVDLRFNRPGNDVLLYKNVFPCTERDGVPFARSLGFVNITVSIAFLAADLQSRAFLRVFKNRVELPPCKEMLEDVVATRDTMLAQFIDRSQLRDQAGTMFVYYEDLAVLAGCYPSIWRLLTERPSGLWAALMTTWNPMQYRLVGDGRLEAAEDWIEDHFMSRFYAGGSEAPVKFGPRGYVGLMDYIVRSSNMLSLGLFQLVIRAMGYKVGPDIKAALAQNLAYAAKDVVPHARGSGQEAQPDQLSKSSVWNKP